MLIPRVSIRAAQGTFIRSIFPYQAIAVVFNRRPLPGEHGDDLLVAQGFLRGRAAPPNPRPLAGTSAASRRNTNLAADSHLAETMVELSPSSSRVGTAADPDWGFLMRKVLAIRGSGWTTLRCSHPRRDFSTAANKLFTLGALQPSDGFTPPPGGLS